VERALPVIEDHREPEPEPQPTAETAIVSLPIAVGAPPPTVVEAAPYADEAEVETPVVEAGYGTADTSVVSEPDDRATSSEEAFAASEADQGPNDDKPADDADSALDREAGKPLQLDRLPDDPGVPDDEKKEPSRFRLF
jgi:uncharacterized membrane-anchored protein